jgi:hypothetical protein
LQPHQNRSVDYDLARHGRIGERRLRLLEPLPIPGEIDLFLWILEPPVHHVTGFAAMARG